LVQVAVVKIVVQAVLALQDKVLQVATVKWVVFLVALVVVALEQLESTEQVFLAVMVAQVFQHQLLVRLLLMLAVAVAELTNPHFKFKALVVQVAAVTLELQELAELQLVDLLEPQTEAVAVAEHLHFRLVQFILQQAVTAVQVLSLFVTHQDTQSQLAQA
jgi:hypothetical protein